MSAFLRGIGDTSGAQVHTAACTSELAPAPKGGARFLSQGDDHTATTLGGKRRAWGSPAIWGRTRLLWYGNRSRPGNHTELLGYTNLLLAVLRNDV